MTSTVPRPLVSIITPVYNSERFLPACLGSVQAQTYQNWEHLLVDDGSTDASSETIKHVAGNDHRVRLTTLVGNHGAAVARNEAIRQADGRFVAFLDSDDMWDPDKLEVQINFMMDNQEPFTFTSYREVDETGEPIGFVHDAESRVTRKSALRKNPIGCLTAVYDTHYFGTVLMPGIKKRQDFGLWLTLLEESDAVGLPDCLASYRVRGGSISSNKLELVKYEWGIYRDHVGFGRAKAAEHVASAVAVSLQKRVRRRVQLSTRGASQGG